MAQIAACEEKTNMTPPMSFFEDEVRDGFLIPSMVKRLWAFSIQSLSVLEGECEKDDVHCSAIFGTLLGAIRHGGFIPWDDDIDMEMLREQYLLLEKRAKSGKLPGTYRIGDYKEDYGENMVRRWMSSNSLVEPYEKWKEHYGFPFVSIMDIFLLDYLPTEEREKVHFWKVMEHAGGIRAQVVGVQNKDINKNIIWELRKVEWELGCRFDLKSEVPLHVQIMLAMDDFNLSYKDKGCDHIGETAYCQACPSRVLPKELYEHFIKLQFEYGEITVPAGYDGVMRGNFGNYMVPVLNFWFHGYPSYKKMNEDARRVSGFELTEYRYDAEKIRIIRESRIAADSVPLAEEMSESIQMLRDAHAYIREHLEDQPDEVVELIGQCQGLAIQMGETIEARAVGPETAVTVLEKYCEHIFAMYQVMAGEVADLEDRTGQVNGQIPDMLDVLTGFEEQIEKAVAGLTARKRIVFLPFKAKHWKGLHTMWQQAIDDGYEATVVAVPYYYRDFDLKIDKETMTCETEGYPEEVELTPYDAYDFEKNHPDRIVCQYPYDEYGGALVLHPFYFMSNLYRYTDELVLVPPFVLREIGESDMQPRYSWGTFLRTPGVMIADKVYVQSENMKKVSVEILSEFTGESMEDRIEATTLPIEQWNEKKRVLIRDRNGSIFKKNGGKTEKTVYDTVVDVGEEMLKKLRKSSDGSGGFKRVLLFRTIGSVLYQYGLPEVERMDKAVRTMEEQSGEVLPVWIEDPYARDVLEEYRPEIWKAYREMVDGFIERDLGVFITAEELGEGTCREELLELADAYYGDACPEMNEMRIRKKPVMWATPGTPIGE